MKNPTICPVCNEGKLHADQTVNFIAYDSSQLRVSCHFHWCDACGTEMTLAEDARANARVCLNAKQEARGKLTGKTIRGLRKYLDITQESAGRIFGGGPVAFCKYENDDLAPSDPMDNLLWLVQKYPGLAKDLAERNDCTPSVEWANKVSAGFRVAYSEIDEILSQSKVTSITSTLSINRKSWVTACAVNTHSEPENQTYNSLIFAEAA